MRQIRIKDMLVVVGSVAFNSFFCAKERSGQKLYFFYPSAGSAQQQAAEH